MKVGNGSEGGDGSESLFAGHIIQLEVDEASEGGQGSHPIPSYPSLMGLVPKAEHFKMRKEQTAISSGSPHLSLLKARRDL
jgi:hypothetical protein